MTLEGRDGRRYLVDRAGRMLDDDYVGPAVYLDADGERVMVVKELDPNSAAIVRALIALGESRQDKPADPHS